MSPEETQQHLKTGKKIHPKHYALHASTFLITFLLGLVADVYIAERIRNQPRMLLWMGGARETNHVNTFGLPRTVEIQIGFRDDGIVIWRDAVGFSRIAPMTNQIMSKP